MLMVDEMLARRQIRSLRGDIRGLKYLIRMEGISRLDRKNPLIVNLGELEGRLDGLLNLVRQLREAERKKIRSSGDRTPDA